MSYANPDALVATDWLEANLENPDVRIIEVDEDTEAYERDHIPGALDWNWALDLHHPLRRDYLDREGFSDLLRKAGVLNDTTVVLYGGNNNWFAAYAYWLLKYRGFSKVKLLDGGRKKWNIENRPLSTDNPAYDKSTVSITGAERPDLRALRDYVLSELETSTFVDVRSPEEYLGEKLAPDHLPQEQPYVGGHVPGAKNIPWSKAANEDGSFKSAGRACGALWGCRNNRRQRRDRILPYRGAVFAHLVRAPRAPRLREGAELRRVVDRVRVSGERSRREVNQGLR